MQTKIERKPDTSKMTVDHQWIEIQTILDEYASGDFSEWEEGLQLKRQDRGYQELVESIRTEGLKHPVLLEHWDDEIVLGNGHHRLAALIDLGYTHVPYTEEFSIGWGLEDGWGEENEK